MFDRISGKTIMKPCTNGANETSGENVATKD